ncbi:MAG: hypothetical protein J6E46_06500 [Faecalicoccus sp.]|nr:hypothetical protein [Faecalicoccus sp.]
MSNSIQSNTIIPVIFVLDTSTTNNEWMRTMVNNSIQHLLNFHKNNSSFQNNIYIGILHSDRWITGNQLIPVQELSNIDVSLNRKGSLKDIAETVSQSLTKENFFNFDKDFMQPSIVFLTNGESFGMNIYLRSAFNLLWNNEIYRSCQRFIISSQGLKNEEVYVNLVHEGTYIDIIDHASVTDELVSDLLTNQWCDTKVDIEDKYKDAIKIRDIIIAE